MKDPRAIADNVRAARMGRLPRGHFVFAVMAAAGLVVSLIGLLIDPRHFFFSYLTAYSACLTLVLGMMFFVLLHYLADAGWSTVVRRPAEQCLAAVPALAVLLLPVLAGMGWLYPWIGAEDELARAKAPFLNVPFFLVRAAVYLAVWLLIERCFRGGSLRQDDTGDPQITLRLRKLSAPGMIAYAVTLTFAAIDWLMTLDYHWFSTIFGTYVWSGSAVSSLALLALLVAVLRNGPLAGKVPIARVHDLGKWVFAFSVFWAYIAFSQYFLIWYANIPEETAWMMARWTGEDGQASWWLISASVPILMFVVPFVALMSANAKRQARVLVPICSLVLVGHYLDCYWLVMPSAHRSGPAWGLIWIDLATLALTVGVCGWFISRALERAAWYPVNDPRLDEALADHHFIEHGQEVTEKQHG